MPKKGYKYSKERNRKLAVYRQGKTYEEIFGVVKARKIKKKLSHKTAKQIVLCRAWGYAMKGIVKPESMRAKLRGEKNSNWRPYGSKLIHNGYVVIKTKKGWKLEHRVKVEKYLGHKLRSNKIVHHKNGNTQDNRIRNLKLMDWSEHTSKHKLSKE